MTPLRAARLPSTLAAVLASAATALALAACDPVQAGNAAIVGADAVSVDRLQEITTQVLNAADADAAQQLNSDTAALQRQELSRIIDGMVLRAAATEFKVTVTEGDIDARLAQLVQQAQGEPQLRQQAVASGISPDEIRAVIRDLVLSDKLAEAVVANVNVTQEQLQAEYDKNSDSFNRVHAAHILVQSKAEADDVLRRVRATPSSFATLARNKSIDTQSAANGGDLGQQGAGNLDPDFARAVFAAKPGTYIEVKTQFGWHVVHVISHDRTTLAQATPQLRRSILSSESDQRMTELLTRVSAALDISVNPRYGRWDNEQRAVVPAPDGLSTPQPSPAGATPTPGIGVPGQPQQPPSG